MRWIRIQGGELASCNHAELPADPHDGPISCSTLAAWRAETSCGCGATHSKLLRCHEHRISDLEDEIARVKRTVEGVVRYARKLNPDIRTDEECVLFAAGYRQQPRDDGDELWKELHAADVAGRN